MDRFLIIVSSFSRQMIELDGFSPCWNNDVGIRDRLQSRRHGRASTIFRCGPFEPFVYEIFHFFIFFFLRGRTAINTYTHPRTRAYTESATLMWESHKRSSRIHNRGRPGTRNQRNQRYFDACACMEFFYLPRSRKDMIAPPHSRARVE